jgi:hypothetical protein
MLVIGRRRRSRRVLHLASEEELEALLRQRPATLSAEELKRLLQMGDDLEAAWQHPAATAATRKRIIRVVLREVVACVEDDQIHLLLHWQGGRVVALIEIDGAAIDHQRPSRVIGNETIILEADGMGFS